MRLKIVILSTVFLLLSLTVDNISMKQNSEILQDQIEDMHFFINQAIEISSNLQDQIDVLAYESESLKEEKESLIEKKEELKNQIKVLEVSVQDNQRVRAPLPNRSGHSIYLTSDLELLARIIQAEALGEPFEGQLAVGGVVMNRVNSPRFPNTIRGVIYQQGQFCGATSRLFHQNIDPGVYKAAKMVLEEGIDKSEGSLFFLNKNVSRIGHLFERNHTFVKRIGDHWFYR